MKRRLTLLLAGLLSATALAQDSATAIGGVLISPLLQRTQVRARQVAHVSFTLENPNPVAQSADYEIRAFTVEPKTYRTLYTESHPRDCAAWFGDPQRQVSLEPGKRTQLKLSYTVPATAEGVYWAMLRFAPRPGGSTTKSSVVYEIPLVVVVGKNPRPVIEVGSPVVEDFPGTPGGSAQMVAVPLTNSGDGFVPVGVTGVIKNEESGQTVAELRSEDRNLLPHSLRHLGFAVPRLRDGRYMITMKAVAGNRTLPTVSSRWVVKKGVPVLASQAQSVAQSALAVEPASIAVTVPAGGARRTSVRIRNNGLRPVTVGVGLSALDQGPSGALDPRPDQLPSGLTVSVSAETNVIEPGATLLAQLDIRVEPTANGDLWFALRVQDATNPNLMAENLIGTVSVPGTAKPGVTVEAAELVKDGDLPVAIKFRLRNSGNVALRPEGSAAMLADGVRLTDRLAVPVVGDGGLLPGKWVENTVMLPPQATAGAYVVELSYQYTEKDSAKLRVPLTVAVKPKARKK